MDVECPECKKKQEIDGDDLPDNACDDASYECKYCTHEFNIGWYATVEIK